MWIDVNERLPKVGENVWYYFEIVGIHRGWYEGIYVDDYGTEYPDMHVFACDYGWLTGDVTHWHPDQEEQPVYPTVH